MLTLYVICIDPILWCILGFLIYSRSRFALAGAIFAVVGPHLLQPWGTLLLERDLGGDTSYFNYWNDVSIRVKSMGIANAVFYVIVLVFTAWELRTRSPR